MTVDWAKLSKAYEEYLDYPTGENADNISVLLPDSGRAQVVGENKDTEESFQTWQDLLLMIEYQMDCGDRSALRLAFRLYAIADGYFGEQLDIMLGNLIRINTRLFLQELSRYEHFLADLQVGLPCGNTGWQYVDRFKAQELEAKLRIEALKKVNDPDLVPIRDRCIKALGGTVEEPEK